MEDLKLSLCIPTNGVIEWVIPVLDSIYAQEVDQSFFEVVVTDNGDNQDFKEAIDQYEKKVTNLVYKETDAKGFTNQICAFKLAKGALIKFVNHRNCLLPGTLQYFLDFVDKNIVEKPYVYFSNGELEFKNVKEMKDFNSFAYNLSYYLSWSAGIALWNTDFHDVNLDKNYSDVFPHLNFILPYSKASKYLLDNTVLFKEQNTDDTKKGKYNLFYTFGVEFIDCMVESYERNEISIRTLKKIKRDNSSFLARLNYLYCMRKEPCSYDLRDKKKSLSKYYNPAIIEMKSYIYMLEYNVKMIIKSVIHVNAH